MEPTLTDTEAVTKTADARATPIIGMSGDGRRSARILLVEDNPVNQEVALGLLEYLCHEVEVADDGKQALRKLHKDHYDLVLMDCEMPVMDGCRATREIRRLEQKGQKSRLPVIALTAHAGVESEKKCLAAGMDAYLSKPFTNEQLLTALVKWSPESPGYPSRR